MWCHKVSRAQPGGGVTFSKAAHTGAHCCFEQEPGSSKVISIFKLCTYASSCVPPSAPTDRHSPSMKRETNVSRGQVDSSPRDPAVTGGSPGRLPPGLVLQAHTPGDTSSPSVPGPAPCRAMGPTSDSKGEHLGSSSKWPKSWTFVLYNSRKFTFFSIM